MERQNKLSRRRFLHLSAVAAGGAMIAACGPQQSSNQTGGGSQSQGGKGSLSKPPEASSKLKEAPMLQRMVDAGELPPLEERLPDNPYVVPHKWLTPGNYGGELLMVTPATDDPSNLEYMYGHSPVRWLNDGLDIGPGLVESWESNDDASEWTLHLRKGLKWSDGEPLTSADATYWWEDMVLNEEHPAIPPDAGRSGAGTLMKLQAPDEVTLVMSFDAPTPLTLALLANGVNSLDWFLPKHYMQQFHPKYNPQIESGNWYETHDEKLNFGMNPERPTMTGWRLKSYREGRNLVWERNPYYWCLDQEGAQLPYVDTITMTAVQDPEVAKLQIQEGKVNYVHGAFVPLTLSDISGLKQTQERTGMRVLLWDSGSGTGSIFFFNYDHPDEKMRNLIRNPKFRQALSHAFNRDEAQKAIYFNTGETTTGTYSPKAIEYQVNNQGDQVYRQWRDAYVEHDPEKARQMLDEIGVVDKDGDGNREMPGGEELIVELDFVADTSEEHKQKNNFLERDWGRVGIKVQQNPVSPEAWETQWNSGKLMSNGAWEVGDGPDHLTGPWWFVPIEPARWAPLEGNFWAVRGTPEEDAEKNVDPYERTPPRMEPEPGGPVDRLWNAFAQVRAEPDEMKRHQMVWDMIKIHIEEGPFFQGTVANYPQITLAHEDMGNVPEHEQLALGGMVNTWAHPTPAVYDPEAYYWENPEEHG